jgi:hypothetical protein
MLIACLVIYLPLGCENDDKKNRRCDDTLAGIKARKRFYLEKWVHNKI